MTLDREDLGAMERRLEWRVIFRIFWMPFIPLFAALLLSSTILKVILWGISAVVFFVLVKLWGHSVIAMMLALVPVYVYFEWDKAPGWLAYIVGVLVVFEILFINRRIKEIHTMNRELYDNQEG